MLESDYRSLFKPTSYNAVNIHIGAAFSEMIPFPYGNKQRGMNIKHYILGPTWKNQQNP